MKLRGSPIAKERKGEPQPTTGAPEAPEFLDAVARAEWDRLVPQLVELGLLTKVDLAALVGYCTCWSDVVRCEKQRAELKSDFFETEFGPRLHPIVKQLNEARRLMRNFLSEFGLSPATRSGVTAEKRQADDSVSAFARKRKA